MFTFTHATDGFPPWFKDEDLVYYLLYCVNSVKVVKILRFLVTYVHVPSRALFLVFPLTFKNTLSVIIFSARINVSSICLAKSQSDPHPKDHLFSSSILPTSNTITKLPSVSEKFMFLIYFSYLYFIDFQTLLQVMYAFVMRPESLPKSYQDFIQKTGPVAEPVYRAVRESCRRSPVDVASLSAYLSSKGKSDTAKLDEFPSIIPCSIIHPDTNSCVAHNANAASSTFKKTFPLYFSLTFVPFVVLHLQKVYLSVNFNYDLFIYFAVLYHVFNCSFIVCFSVYHAL